MTSTPDQSPAATEVGKVPATDPVEQAPAVESEQDPRPEDSAGSPAEGGADEPEARVAATGTPVEDEPDPVEESSADESSADEAVEPSALGSAVSADSADAVGSPDTVDAANPAESAESADSADAVDQPASADAAATPEAPDSPVSEVAAPEVTEAPSEEPTGLPRRPARDQAPTEEISVVPPAAADTTGPGPATEPGPITGTGRTGTTDADAGVDTDSTVESAASPSDAVSTGDAPAEPAATPAVDEPFDFKALSFAAIAEAHKRALGPRTVGGEAEEEQPSGNAAAASSTESAPHTDESAPAEAADRSSQDQAPDAAPALFVSPATHTPPSAPPPSPFPTPAAPQQHQPDAPGQPQPSIPLPPPSPFPTSPAGSAHGFPAVHDYAPGTSYAGWRPPTEADDAARRRRFMLIGGAALALIAVVVVISVVVNMVSRQQWEPIEAMIAEPQEVHPLQLVLGSCVKSIPEDGEVSEVLAVPCDASHAAQVVGRTDFADAAVWPGRDAVDKRVALVCGTKQLGPVARTSAVADSVRYVVWGPSEASWDDGDRVGLCLATTAEPITQGLLQ